MGLGYPGSLHDSCYLRYADSGNDSCRAYGARTNPYLYCITTGFNKGLSTFFCSDISGNQFNVVKILFYILD